MPVASYDIYCKMIDHARKNKFAYPAVNVTSMGTASAVLEALGAGRSDGIIQVSTGGAAFASGTRLKDMVLGAKAIAEFVHAAAEKYDIYVALHTDHCTLDKIDSFLNPLIALTEERRAKGLPNLFNSHMFDGSTISLEQNIEVCHSLLERCGKSEIILETELGVVGGEEDGVKYDGVDRNRLYTNPSEMVAFWKAMQDLEYRYLVAATFGNVHGVYKPGNVELRPEVLRDGQEALRAAGGVKAEFDLVFHGGSGSGEDEVHETINYGVVKMNIDTAAQYAYTRPIVDHMFRNYNWVLNVDGELGDKKKYDPRSYLKEAEESMTILIEEYIQMLRSFGQTIFPS